jgi:dGTPase
MKWEQLLNRERPRKSTNPPGDHRTEFERDFDRAVFSNPVKRLQDKAQVFPLELHDAVRTRLTHSLEVSSVARGIAIDVAKWLVKEKEIEAGKDRWIEAIAATCGLIHDLGNPPFGHSGEKAIREWFEDRFGRAKLSRMCRKKPQLVQDLLKFGGNAQSLRLIGKLQILADYNGLNLTYGTLSASCKYTARSHEAGKGKDHAKEKPGFFASENKLVKQIREVTGTGEARNPIAFLVEAADDIVYSVADVEDGVKKGIVSWRRIKKRLMEAQAPCIGNALDHMERILKAGRNNVPDDLPPDVYASAFRTAAIRVAVKAVTDAFKDRYHEIMRGVFRGELVRVGSAAPLTRELKQIGQDWVYCTPSTLKLELMGRRVILELMDAFWEGAEVLPVDGPPRPTDFPGKAGALLSDNYRRVFQHFVKEMPEIPETYHRFQLVTDYVCGMTDSFAKRLHAELTNG